MSTAAFGENQNDNPPGSHDWLMHAMNSEECMIIRDPLCIYSAFSRSELFQRKHNIPAK